jgi:hypothetical protein
MYETSRTYYELENKRVNNRYISPIHHLTMIGCTSLLAELGIRRTQAGRAGSGPVSSSPVRGSRTARLALRHPSYAAFLRRHPRHRSRPLRPGAVPPGRAEPGSAPGGNHLRHRARRPRARGRCHAPKPGGHGRVGSLYSYFGIGVGRRARTARPRAVGVTRPRTVCRIAGAQLALDPAAVAEVRVADRCRASAAVMWIAEGFRLRGVGESTSHVPVTVDPPGTRTVCWIAGAYRRGGPGASRCGRAAGRLAGTVLPCRGPPGGSVCRPWSGGPEPAGAGIVEAAGTTYWG